MKNYQYYQKLIEGCYNLSGKQFEEVSGSIPKMLNKNEIIMD